MSEYQLTESGSLEAELLAKLQAKYSESRTAIHVSDLILCARQSLARRLDPRPPTPQELSYYVDGAARHHALQALYGDGIAEHEVELEGVSCHVDIYDDRVIEYKSTRGTKAVGEHWLRQVIYYLLATKTREGTLIVQRINYKKAKAGKQTPFEVYTVSVTPLQFEHALEDFRSRRSAFLAALEAKDMKLAPIWRGEGDWLCRGCRFKEPCDRIEGVNRTGK